METADRPAAEPPPWRGPAPAGPPAPASAGVDRRVQAAPGVAARLVSTFAHDVEESHSRTAPAPRGAVHGASRQRSLSRPPLGHRRGSGPCGAYRLDVDVLGTRRARLEGLGRGTVTGRTGRGQGGDQGSGGPTGRVEVRVVTAAAQVTFGYEVSTRTARALAPFAPVTVPTLTATAKPMVPPAGIPSGSWRQTGLGPHVPAGRASSRSARGRTGQDHRGRRHYRQRPN